jgi:hypothetical protein
MLFSARSFHSLQRCVGTACDPSAAGSPSAPASLFVHVPSFATIAQDAQMAFVRDLIIELATAPAILRDAPPAPDWVGAEADAAAAKAAAE